MNDPIFVPSSPPTQYSIIQQLLGYRSLSDLKPTLYMINSGHVILGPNASVELADLPFSRLEYESCWRTVKPQNRSEVASYNMVTSNDVQTAVYEHIVAWTLHF